MNAGLDVESFTELVINIRAMSPEERIERLHKLKTLSEVERNGKW